MVLDALAGASNAIFSSGRYGDRCPLRHKGRTFLLLKPSTYMNNSGRAVAYWLKAENIPTENLMVIVDDMALPLGTIRIRPRGSDGGHNGLRSINDILGTQDFSRLRIGIGNDFPKGGQVNHVLSQWLPEELEVVKERVQRASEAVLSFGTIGLERTMNQFNSK